MARNRLWLGIGVTIVALVAVALWTRRSPKAAEDRATRLERVQRDPWFHLAVTPPPSKEAPAEETSRAAVELTGVVRDQLTGAPIPDAEVRTYRNWTAVDSVWADGDGVFLFPPAAPESFDRVAARAPGYAMGMSLVRRGMEVVDVLLAPSVRISGRVEDGNGEPIPGAEVVVSDTVYGTWPCPQSSKVLTDATGQFRIDDAPSGSLVIEARRAGFAETEKELGSFGPGRALDEIVLALEAAATVTGTVSLEGKPVPDAPTTVRIDGLTKELWTAYTRADGTFTIGGVPAGTGTILTTVEAVGYGGAEISTQIGQTTEVSLELLRMPEVQGRVRDETGKPVEGARVRYSSQCTPDTSTLPPSVAAIFESGIGRIQLGPSYGSTHTDEEGRFSATPKCGPLEVTVTHEGYARLDQEVAVPSTPELTISRGLTVAGSVVDASGELVEVEGDVDAKGPNWTSAHTAVTGGRFEFVGLVEGEWRLSLQHPELGRAATTVVVGAERPAGPVTLVVSDTAMVTGRVVSGGHPVAGATVGVGRSGYASVRIDDRWEIRTGADGRFRLPAPAGEIRILVYHPEHRTRVRTAAARAGTTTDLGDLSLVPGQGARAVATGADLGALISPREREEGRFYVGYVWEESGAAAAGIAVGDGVVSIDGVELRGMTRDEAAEHAEGEPWSMAEVVLIPGGTGEPKVVHVERIPQHEIVRITQDGSIITAWGY